MALMLVGLIGCMREGPIKNSFQYPN